MVSTPSVSLADEAPGVERLGDFLVRSAQDGAAGVADGEIERVAEPIDGGCHALLAFVRPRFCRAE
jgi:hypothetical protein